MTGWKLKALGVVSAALVVVSLLAWGHYERSGREAAEKAAQSALANLRQSEENREIERALQSGVALVDQIQTKRLRDAKYEIDNLRGRVAAGAVQLRINASCPDRVPEAPGGSELDPGAGPRLTDSAAESYFTLRDRIEQVTAQLEACQDILKTIHNQTE